MIAEYEVERLKKAVDALMVSNAEKVNKYTEGPRVRASPGHHCVVVLEQDTFILA